MKYKVAKLGKNRKIPAERKKLSVWLLSQRKVCSLFSHHACGSVAWTTTKSGMHNNYYYKLLQAIYWPRSTQPGRPFVGRRNEYQPKGGDALRLGSKGRYGTCVGGKWNCV